MRIIEAGELTVTDKGSIQLPLGRKPKQVTVRFKEEYHKHHSCDIDDHKEHKDKIECFLYERDAFLRKSKDFIIISWDLHSSSRTIIWECIE